VCVCVMLLVVAEILSNFWIGMLLEFLFVRLFWKKKSDQHGSRE